MNHAENGSVFIKVKTRNEKKQIFFKNKESIL